MIALKRILVPTDFSDTSQAAVQYGVAFARAFGAKLYLMHAVAPLELETILEGERVVEDSIGGGVAVSSAPASLDEIAHNAAHAQLAKVLTEDEEQELQPEYELRSSGQGGAYVEVVRCAQEHDIDLIVMGTHGRGFMAHLLMGSVAEKVVRKAPCPVLTVHHPEHEFVVPDA